ncbi:MAG: hypothetical protein LBO09_02610 [Candidatus Peribacteria bacterium]|jgi:hypothetical protein|nr:hypothetical protein [Candidatus Peribacteria bacterium]
MEKRDTYDSWLLDPKRTEEKVKKQEQKKEKESFLKKDKQEYYETMGVQ